MTQILTPPDFPVNWDNPAAAKLTWTFDAVQSRDQMTPLDFSLRLQGQTAGIKKANQAYQLLSVTRFRLINTYVYRTNILAKEADPEKFATQLKIAEEKLRAKMFELGKLWEESWLPEIKKHLVCWENYDLNGATLPALLEHLEETRRRIEQMWEIHFVLCMPMGLAMGAFDDMYRDIFYNAEPFAAYQLLAGFENKTVESGHRLWELSRQALSSPLVYQTLRKNEAADVIVKLAETEEGEAFWQKLEAHLQLYGQQNDSAYIDSPTWIEEPTLVIKNLQGYIAQPDQNLREKQAKIAGRREEKIARVRQHLEDYPQFAALEFKNLLKAAQVANVLREDHSFWIDYKITHYARQVCLELGRRLSDMGLIEQRDDVFYLTVDELKIADKPQPVDFFRALIQERRAEAEQFAKCTPPQMLGAAPTSSFDGFDNAISRTTFKFFGMPPQNPFNSAKGKDEDKSVNELKGLPGSNGKVKGRVKIMHALSDSPKLKPGDILVAKVITPSWTPIFITVAAIVTDIGGVLSHAAVVAREYKIPAVVGAQTATTMLKDGQTIKVDGDRGVVRIL